MNLGILTTDGHGWTRIMEGSPTEYTEEDNG